MKYTLLEMVSQILSAMDSDEVNSISDTVESNQVALLIKGVYYDLSTDLNLTEHETLFELNASLDSSKPCLMTVPSNVTELRWVKYDIKESGETLPNFRDVPWVDFNTFLNRQQSLRTHTSNVDSMEVTLNGETFTTMFYTNKAPSFFTTIDDHTLLFDSYDNTVDTTLQKSKTLCYGVVYPVFNLTDDFTPDLDPTQFSLLLNKSKERAFNELKQNENREAIRETRRQKIIVQKRKRKVFDTDPIFKVKARYGRT